MRPVLRPCQTASCFSLRFQFVTDKSVSMFVLIIMKQKWLQYKSLYSKIKQNTILLSGISDFLCFISEQLE